MSFDKKTMKDIDRVELTEMARTILNELSMNENLRLKDFSETKTAEDMDAACRFGFREKSIAGNLNRGWGRQKGTTQGSFDSIEGTIPRSTRADFLAQRLERRRERADKSIVTDKAPFILERTAVDDVPFTAKSIVADTVSNNEGLTDSDKNIKSDEPVYSELSEKISEMVCRDARRYDGAFERY